MCEHLSISESAQALMEPPKAMPSLLETSSSSCSPDVKVTSVPATKERLRLFVKLLTVGRRSAH